VSARLGPNDIEDQVFASRPARESDRRTAVPATALLGADAPFLPAKPMHGPVAGRPARSPVPDDSTAEETTPILTGDTPIAVLRRLLASYAPREAVLAALLDTANWHRIAPHHVPLPFPAYLRRLSHLCAEAAEQVEAGGHETDQLFPANPWHHQAETDPPFAQEAGHTDPQDKCRQSWLALFNAQPQPLRDALSRRDFNNAIVVAIQQGWRDPNQLTDLIFFAETGNTRGYCKLGNTATDARYRQRWTQWLDAVRSALSRPTPVTPLPVAGCVRQDGIDVYVGNQLPSFNDIRAAGVRFIMHKSSERTRGGGLIDDGDIFKRRWADTAASGLIRGSYHYYRHQDGATGDVQAERVAMLVGRLVPGDMAPALDFENDALVAGSHEPTAAEWRTEIEAFLDRIETRLGRTPLIYTSASAWQSHVNGKRDFRAVDFARFGEYPLWVKAYFGGRFVDGIDLDNEKHKDAAYQRAAAKRADAQYNVRGTLRPPLPVSWSNWELFQYSPFTPGVLLNHHPFTESEIDFNVSRRGLHGLRGLADLGRTAPHVVGNLSYIAYAEADGGLLLLELLAGRWHDSDVLVSAPGAPPASGDPAAIGLGNEQIIAYRARDSHVFILARRREDAAWNVSNVASGAVDDPCIAVTSNDVHVVFRDQNDRQAHLVRTAGKWQADDLATASGAPAASGSAIAYQHANDLHIVSRAGTDGHLVELCRASGIARHDDITATAHDADGRSPPPATYRPTTFARPNEAARIVFRARRGAIWLVERDTLRAQNLAAAAVNAASGVAGAPRAAGSPTAIASDTARVFYRAVDGTIIEISDNRTTVAWREVCTGAAADPMAFVDAEGPKVTFRAEDGSIQVARLANGAWICESATTITRASQPIGHQTGRSDTIPA
jgi:GH25 family lysozyme M1 (1,4-beta-N-acetylmuramidase)